MDINECQKLMATFRDDRDWAQFHSPENLAKSIAIEAGELLECFQWNAACNIDELAHEMADVFSYLILLADETGINLEDAFLKKMRVSAEKYPIGKSKGISTKYDKL